MTRANVQQLQRHNQLIADEVYRDGIDASSTKFK
jgi:hypothetical protein